MKNKSIIKSAAKLLIRLGEVCSQDIGSGISRQPYLNIIKVDKKENKATGDPDREGK